MAWVIEAFSEQITLSDLRNDCPVKMFESFERHHNGLFTFGQQSPLWQIRHFGICVNKEFFISKNFIDFSTPLVLPLLILNSNIKLWLLSVFLLFVYCRKNVLSAIVYRVCVYVSFCFVFVCAKKQHYSLKISTTFIWVVDWSETDKQIMVRPKQCTVGGEVNPKISYLVIVWLPVLVADCLFFSAQKVTVWFVYFIFTSTQQ